MYSKNSINKQECIQFISKFGAFMEDEQRTGDKTLQHLRIYVLRVVNCLTLWVIYKA